MRKISRSAVVLIIQAGESDFVFVMEHFPVRSPGHIYRWSRRNNGTRSHTSIPSVWLVYRCFTFVNSVPEVCLFFFSLIPIHPLAHNIILLSITPAYRRFINTFIRKAFKVSLRLVDNWNDNCMNRSNRRFTRHRILWQWSDQELSRGICERNEIMLER